jgi:hypothetical protein
LISFADKYTSACQKEAHPGGEQRYTTIDVSKSGAVAYLGSDSFGAIEEKQLGKAVFLTALFPEKDIYHALLSNHLIGRMLTSEEDKTAPPTLTRLLMELSGRNGPDGTCFFIPDDLLSRFTFSHIENDKIMVQLGLPGSGWCRDDLTALDLLLSIPDDLKSALARAESRTEGFLKKEADETMRDAVTTVRARTGRGGSR